MRKQKKKIISSRLSNELAGSASESFSSYIFFTKFLITEAWTEVVKSQIAETISLHAMLARSFNPLKPNQYNCTYLLRSNCCKKPTLTL